MSVLFIADVDGVFTNEKAEPNEEAITLSAQIGVREPFAYVTGRGRPWLGRNFLPTLASVYRNQKPKKGIICAEYGAFGIRWINSEWRSGINSDLFSIPDALRDEIRIEIEQLSDGVFFDKDKEIMISVEARHELREENGELVVQRLDSAERILRGHAGKHVGLEYQRTTYACDLVPRGMNKAFGARHILTSIMFPPKETHLIGDSLSDLLLAEPFIEEGIPYTLHFVGDPALITPEVCQKYVIDIPSKRYDEGTLEVLKRFS
jgi:hydroxymethylpyrimidine pyrophosphatase-like HAD family hydrolase